MKWKKMCYKIYIKRVKTGIERGIGTRIGRKTEVLIPWKILCYVKKLVTLGITMF